jgi:hypothetical protein
MLVLLMMIGAAGPMAAQPADDASIALAAAKDAFVRGETQNALEELRKLRTDFPGSIAAIDSLDLSSEYSLALGDVYRARYFLQKLLDEAPGSKAAFEASVALAEYYYSARSWLAALEYYEDAVEGFQEGVTGRRADLDLSLLRVSELSLYHDNNPVAARSYFMRIHPQTLPAAEIMLYREMRVRLLWSVLSAQSLSLRDANISCLRIDGDDLWVGTWNGGAARYSVSSGSSDAFPSPAFTRSIEVADRRVWVGTAEGLSWYGKNTARWGSEPDFGGPTPRKVQALRATTAGLYAGTLGDGLFHLGADGWDPVSDGSLPGRFITCLAEDAPRARLLIGTMNIGLVVLDLKTGSMSTLAESLPDFTTDNITTILTGADGRIWIGTYGEGLSVWSPDSNGLRHFTKASGEITDDWILASCETDRALYFGGFGGGVSVLSKREDTWRHIGIAEGLASLDVAAIAWRAPYVFFGTLRAGVCMYDEAADGALP